MSHEIRTPLNAIIGMAELLSETSLSGEQNKYVNVFRRAGEALLELVNEILDLSKIEAGQLILEYIDFNVHELVEHATDIYALKCEEKGIKLAVDVADGIPAYVNGDPSRLRQIILNLIGNAIKFTDQGEIIVSVERPRNTGTNTLRFSVADTGIGIPAEKLEAIFASFTQVDSSTTRKYGGTGLGLTICKRLVEMMAGTIWGESEQGRGSTFLFEAEFEAAAEQSRAQTVTSPAPVKTAPDRQVQRTVTATTRRSILLVEDTVDNRMLVKAYLKNEPYEIDEAENGEIAVEKFKTGKYDLVLMDVQMPVMDGHSATRAIREWEEKQSLKPTPVIALTAHAVREEMDKSIGAGCTAHLTKPIKKATLVATLTQHLA